MAVEPVGVASLKYDLFDKDEPKPKTDGDKFNSWHDESEEKPFVPAPFEPPSIEESNRRAGLAWSAGTVFFGSIVFMLGLGWIGDLILGSSPWGLVVGIVLGSIIGFVQFFRISSQIFGSNKTDEDIGPLFSNRDKDDR